jgi:hypothetical protein
LPYDTKEKQQAWRLQNRERSRVWREKVYKARYDYLCKAKARPCVDCGVQYPFYIMEFDHVRGSKKNTVFTLWNNLNAMLEELAKCDVVCSNCHAARTYFRRMQETKGK